MHERQHRIKTYVNILLLVWTQEHCRTIQFGCLFLRYLFANPCQFAGLVMLTNLLWFFVQYILVSCITYRTSCIYLLVHSYSSRRFICIHSIIVVWYIALTCYIYITHRFIIEASIFIEVIWLKFVIINFNPLSSFSPVRPICRIYIMINVLIESAC